MKNLFPEKLRTLRGSQSKQEFCQKLGISYSAYSRYESGERSPDWDSIIKICTIINVSADWLLGLRDDQIPSLHGSPSKLPASGMSVADQRETTYLGQTSPPPQCPHCAAKQDQIDKLVDTLHNLSVGRSLPARNCTSVPEKY